MHILVSSETTYLTRQLVKQLVDKGHTLRLSKLWNPYLDQAVCQERERRVYRRQFIEIARENRRNQMKLTSRGVIAGRYQWLQVWPRARYRRRLRRAIQRTAVRFGEQYPEWQEFFFDVHFLLNRGLPIIERHFSAAAATDAMDLALAWSEQLPQMRTERRKFYLQALTPLATEFLHLMEGELTNPGSVTGAGSAKQRIGVPTGYVQANS